MNVSLRRTVGGATRNTHFIKKSITFACAVAVACSQPTFAGITGVVGTPPANARDAKYQSGVSILGPVIDWVAGKLGERAERGEIEKDAKEALKNAPLGTIAAMQRETVHADTWATQNSVLSGQSNRTTSVGLGTNPTSATAEMQVKEAQPQLDVASMAVDNKTTIYAQKNKSGGVTILELTDAQKRDIAMAAAKENAAKAAAEKAAREQAAREQAEREAKAAREAQAARDAQIAAERAAHEARAQASRERGERMFMDRSRPEGRDRAEKFERFERLGVGRTG